MNAPKLGIAGRLAGAFIDSKLTPLVIIASLLLGLMAVAVLPREEEPQIVVPMVDVFVQHPGATAKEVEQRVTAPMEKLLWEIPGVEYIYSTSMPGMSMATVRFKVGENEENALVRLNQKLFSNMDRAPAGASMPLVKARGIDDVPVLALTLSSDAYDHFMLRRIAAQLHDDIKQIPDVSEVQLIGGERRRVLVSLDPGRMAAHGVAPAMLPPALTQANQQLQSGRFASGDRDILVEAGSFLSSAEDVGSLVVGARAGSPVYLRDVATITDGPDEPADYVFFGTGAAHASSGAQRAPLSPSAKAAVTISVAKRKGTNAIELAETIIEKVDRLKGTVIPSDVTLTVTRNYGETAAEKSNELLFHMLIAIGSVTLLMWITLGRRESGIVAIAIPVTLALTLAIFSLFGYTLNRVTLFALIFSIGILVDDAIVVVENIVRHFRLPENHGRPLKEIAIQAVDEVGNPTILATFAVIAAILPMGFVRGLMGPYMRPIPVGASAAMLFSLLVAFVVTPWASIRLLNRDESHAGGGEGKFTRMFRGAMQSLLVDGRKRTIFLGIVGLLLVLSVALFGVKLVKVKMLPFDNKSEFQVVIDMPEGTTLERTTAVAQEVAAVAAAEPEVENFQIYAGTAAPFNFNGLVRHYFLRRGPNVADVQINLVEKGERDAQSHDIARRVREKLAPIAERTGASLKVAEVPPGPPVLQTLVAEIYGPDYGRQIEIAKQVEGVFRDTDGVVDVDSYVEGQQQEVRFAIDNEKAALHGVTTEQIAATLRIALSGMDAGLVHDENEREDVPITLRLPRQKRSSIGDLETIRVMNSSGALVPLGALVRIEEGVSQRNIYHKNLMPVVYVTADVSGVEESPVYAILKLNKALDRLELPEGYAMERHTAAQPESTESFAMKWDGEWHITYEVFRDLGIAFAVVLILIYILVVGWFESFKTPFTIMATIPFSLIGIIPMHAVVGTFFTATSMIGFIAGAGIVVRNSIILVDFIELRMKQGMPLAQAVIDAGAVRFRPIMLTAAAVVVGAAVMFFDPIFQGLAISLMAGSVAAAILSPVTVPVLYYLAERKRETQRKAEGGATAAIAETPAGA
jgi:multidrug efflux pump subunit AcrB